MGSFKERSVFPATFSGDLIHDKVVVTNDVTRIDLGDIGAADTFTLTPTRVDFAVADATTGVITFVGAGGQAAAMQTAIRAKGGIYANATVVFVSAELYDVTVFGGYDVTWAVASPTTFTPGSVVETTAGSVVYTKQFGIGKFADVKKVIAKGFNENSLVISVTDADSKTVYAATIDTSTASADVPYVRLLTADGVAGEDGAAAANASGGSFRGPLTAVITTNAPYHVNAAQPVVKPSPRLTFVIAGEDERARKTLKRTSGARTTLTGTIDLGAAIVNIKRIRLFSSSDTSVAPTLTDADGLVVYTKASTDYTTAVLEQLSHEGIDQAGNALADTLDVIAKSPLTLSGSGLGAGTFQVDLQVAV